jgi:hypothetical protein
MNLNLTPDQHLDAIEAVALHHGGKFKWLENKIPAYKHPSTGKWTKLSTTPADWSFDKFLEDTQLSPFKVPTSKAPLGGLARWQDTQRLHRSLKDIFSQLDVGLGQTMSAKQIALRVTQALTQGGLVFAGRGSFVEIAERALSRSPSVASIENALYLGGHEYYYPEHHTRLRAAPMEDRLVKDGQLRVLGDPDKLLGMAVNQANANPFNVHHFVKFLHANSCKANLYLTLHDQPGDPEKLDQEVKTYLTACFTEFQRTENGNALHAALSALKFAYSPLPDKPSLAGDAHIANLRALLRNSPPPAPEQDSPQAAPDTQRVDLVERVALRTQADKLCYYAESLPLPTDTKVAWGALRSALDEFAVVGGDKARVENALSEARVLLTPVARQEQRTVLTNTKTALTAALAAGNEPMREVVEAAWSNAMAALKDMPIENAAELVGVCQETFSPQSLQGLCQGLSAPVEQVDQERIADAKQNMDQALGLSIKW